MPAALTLEVESLASRPELIRDVAGWLCVEWHRELGYTLAETEELLHDRARPRGLPCAWLALLEGEPAGIVGLEEAEHPTAAEQILCLTGLFVRRRARRQGVATALCARASEEAAALGHTSLHLFARTAAPFYAQRAWRPLGEVVRKTPLGLELELFMQKSLRRLHPRS